MGNCLNKLSGLKCIEYIKIFEDLKYTHTPASARVYTHTTVTSSKVVFESILTLHFLMNGLFMGIYTN